MIALSTFNKLPRSALGYLLVVRIIVGAILILIGIMLLSAGTIQGTKTINGVISSTSFSATIPALILILLGVFLPCYSIFWYLTFSFMVSEQGITINSGVLFRSSRTIDFNKVQNVDNTRGPLQMMFGLTGVNIWTASQDQLRFSTVTIGGIPRTRASARPDGKLYLSGQDADYLKDYIAKKSSVQNVQMVSPGIE